MSTGTAPARVITIGTFDGVHRGHQALLGRAAEHAGRLSSGYAALTFAPPPRAVLRPAEITWELTPGEEKVHWLEAAGAQVAVVAFTPEFARMDPLDFLNQIVRERYRPAVIVEGHDFTFGRQALGTVAVLREWARERGIEVEVLDPVDGPHGVVSSSAVRAMVRDGRLDEARALLGRPYSALGQVRRGDGRGRTLGFPTANLWLPPTKLMPPYGIYAGYAEEEEGGARTLAVASWGVRPMFATPTPLLEVHLIGVTRDLYDRRLWFQFGQFLRAEERFSGTAALVDAIREDVRQAEDWAAGR